MKIRVSVNKGWLIHSARTAVAAAVSLAAARLAGMPEAYWASISTLIAMQSSLGAAWNVSKPRFIGTALGAAAGGLLASYLHVTLPVFAAAIFFIGLVCAALGLDQSAYRYAGITFTIVTLVTKAAPYVEAIHRFAEVSIGIAVALLMSAIWPVVEK